MEKLDFTHVGKNLEESEKINKPHISYWQDAFRRLKENKFAIVALVFLVFIVLMTIIGPFLNHFGFRQMNNNLQFKFWDLESLKMGHYFGTDDFGRDFFTRVWKGGRISLLIAIVVVSLEALIGILYGGIAGYIGGKTDFFMMRFVEIMMSIPSMIYIILLMVVMGAGVNTIIIAMAATRWLYMAMIIRGEVLRLKEKEYVMASIALGASPIWVITKHLIPNAMGQILVRITLDLPAVIFTEAFLSFIGIGIPAPTASWGSLANSGYKLMNAGPHLFLIPAILISLTTLAFNILGDGLRDALDPRLRK
ncbi:MAG: ABC transporter permease [Fusobacteriota bacterium]